MEKKFIPLKDLEVYRLARELSKIAWEIYDCLDWQDRKTMGDQFLTASDSIGQILLKDIAVSPISRR
jgi:hypothetical protein